jgi:hypothetical protein
MAEGEANASMALTGGMAEGRNYLNIFRYDIKLLRSENALF